MCKEQPPESGRLVKHNSLQKDTKLLVEDISRESSATISDELGKTKLAY
jgi:hypothetical protein